MTACLFGTYDRGHSANRLLRRALTDAGYALEELHQPLWEDTRDKDSSYFAGPSLAGLAGRWLAAGRRLAAEASVNVDWVEGDAEAIPYPDDSFDVVLSTFGCMFAPRHQVAAAELARVLRPGGRLGLCNWTPEGSQGHFFRALGAYLPPPPDFAQPPLLWGREDHVRELFAGSGVQLEFERDTAIEAEPFATGRDAVDFIASNFGPLMMLRGRLEAQGVWGEVREKLEALYERHDPAEYLVVLGRKG